MGEIRQHRLEIYEPYDYDGPNPLPVLGKGLIRGANGIFYYLLEREDGAAIPLGDRQVRQLLVLPRYAGDPPSTMQENSCTVNIELVHDDVTLQPGMPFSYNDVEHWGVGKITQA
ncbi:MAG: hypothetical protein D6721_01900 [Gammaproteobacteria bacterium]|nr:MAG: hypothetical protein D6721_01900 [Gammaproteobacteria bacterium]